MCPVDDAQPEQDEMGIILSGSGETQQLHVYPRGPHPADRRMFTGGIQPAINVDQLSATL